MKFVAGYLEYIDENIHFRRSPVWGFQQTHYLYGCAYAKGYFMDIAYISAALSSIKTATDIAKLIKDTDVSLEKAESKLKFADLISALADAKIQIADIQQLLIEKDDDLRKVKEQLVIKEKLIWEAPFYWQNVDNKKDGPYCQQCYDKHHDLIRLQGNGEGFWECKTCKNSYLDSSWNPSSCWGQN